MNDLILLHGALGSSSSLEHIKKELYKSFNFHLFDFSGHGQSPFNPDGFGIEYFAVELAYFIEEKELSRPNVFGYSMGGYVALYLAQQQPALLGKIVTLGTKFAWSPESADHEVSRLNPELMLEKIPAYAIKLANTHGEQWKELVWQTAGMMIELGEHPLLTVETLNAIQNDVLVMRGADDQMVSDVESKWATAHLPNGNFNSIVNQPHPIEKTSLSALIEVIKTHL